MSSAAKPAAAPAHPAPAPAVDRILVATGVRKVYRTGAVEVEALRGLDLTVRRGEFVAVMGASGSGKTTLLRAITGHAPVAEGSVAIGGRDMTSVDPAERDIAMVFQNLALYPHMTVRGNWEFPLKAARLDKAEVERRVRQVADTLQMGKLLHRLPHELSGGQKQRVAIARGIAKQTDVFVLDDPLAGLDFKLREQLVEDLRELQAETRATFLYTTSDVVEAMTLADTLAVLDDGRIVEFGTHTELLARDGLYADLYRTQFFTDDVVAEDA